MFDLGTPMPRPSNALLDVDLRLRSRFSPMVARACAALDVDKLFGHIERSAEFSVKPAVLEALRKAREVALTFGPADDRDLLVRDVLGSLKADHVPTVLDDLYQEVLVPMSPEWGLVAAENAPGRLDMYGQPEGMAATTRSAADEALAAINRMVERGNSLLLGEGFVIAVTPAGAARLLRGLRERGAGAGTDEKPDAADLLAVSSLPSASIPALVDGLAEVAGVEGQPRTAVITQPHRDWQRVNAGASSTFPVALQESLLASSFDQVSYYHDDEVTLELFDRLVREATTRNVAFWYHQGHGSRDKLYLTSSYPGPYITAEFIRNRASFPSTFVYIYACATLRDDALATAFLAKGARAYGGWTWLAKAGAQTCDLFDHTFFADVLAKGAAVRRGLDQVRQKNLTPYELRGQQTEFQLRGELDSVITG